MKTIIVDVLNPNTLHIHAAWFILTWAAVVFAMTVDLITGLRKAKQAGIARTSEALKRTCDKAIKYFFPMLCLMPVDVLASVVLPVPAFTMAMAAFNVLCEFKSVMEKTHTKKEIREAANTMQVVVRNKDDILQSVSDLLARLSDDKEQPKGE